MKGNFKTPRFCGGMKSCIFLILKSEFIEAGTRGLSTPTGLVANDLRCVAFLIRFKVDDEYDVASVGGGKLGGVAICL